MFSHVMVGANDVQESKVFYDAVLGAMGYEPGVIDEKGRCFYFTKSGVFAISSPIDGKPACMAMVVPSALPQKIRRKLMLGTRRASLMAARHVKTRRARVNSQMLSSILPIYAIHPVTKFALSIEWVDI